MRDYVYIHCVEIHFPVHVVFGFAVEISEVSLLGCPRGGFVVEHDVLSRAGIGSDFDQCQRKLHKLSQLLVHTHVSL